MNQLAMTEHISEAGVDAQNPWPGLVAFSEDLRDYFHGRAEEAEDLLRRVDRKNLTVLFGQSGLGKSSLLQAGLFPKLRAEGYLPVPIRLDHAPSGPSLTDQVTTAVKRAIVEAGGRPDAIPTKTGDLLWEFLHSRSLILETADGRSIRPVLVFDQFEELFAIGQASEATRSRAASFLTELADFVENRAPESLERRLDDAPELVKQFIFDDRDYRVLVSLREDYLPHLEGLRRVMPSITENRMRLTRMNGERALDAVTIPGGDLITAEVGRQVVRFVAGGRTTHGDDAATHSDGLSEMQVEPSLLSLVCRELNNRRLAAGLPQITSDLLAGNRERILQDFYERCVADQPAEVRAFVEDELVTDSGHRENIALERARKALTTRGVSASAIDVLVKRRLLHLEDRLDIQRVELTHDVLTTVIKKSRDERQAQEATLRAEGDAAAVRKAARLQRRRLRMIVGGLAVALAIVSAFGIASYQLYRVSEDRLLEAQRQKREADRQTERAEKGEAEAQNARKESEVVKEVFDAATTPVTEENIRHTAGLGPVQEELANLRVKSLELLATKSPNDPTIAPKVAQAYAVLGIIRTYVGSFDRAAEDLRTAAELYGTLSKEHPDSLEYRLGEIRAIKDLGYLYWDDNRNAVAHHWYEDALKRLEVEYTRDPEDSAVCYELGQCLIRMGGTLPNETTKEDREKFATRGYNLFESLIAKKYREVDSRAALAVAAYRLIWARFDGKDQAGLLNSFEGLSALNKAAWDLAPDSPYLNTFPLFDHDDRADALVMLGRAEEAVTERKAVVTVAHELVKRSPHVSRYASLLAQALKNLGTDLRRLQRNVEAQTAFEESNKIINDAVRQFSDRAFLASRWIDYRNELADFFEYGAASHPQGPIKARQELLSTLEQTLTDGREMADRFQDHHWLQVNFAKTLNSRGRYDNESRRFHEALPYFLEAAEIYRTRVFADRDSTTTDDVTTYLNYLQIAADCANSAGKPDEVFRIAELAMQVRDRCTSRAGLDDLGTILTSAGRIHRATKRYDEAIAVFMQAIEVRRPAYEKATWHWYLENNLGSTYMNLADTYHDAKDFRNEVLSNREYLRMIVGPRYGVKKIDDYVDSSRPTDEAEANRIRDFIANTTKSGMKRFTIPCDFSGIKYPFHVYVTNVAWPKHPLEDQARWLKEERGGTIPKDVMDSFEKLHKIAHENNVSFVELCVYALGTVNEDDGTKRQIEDVGEDTNAAQTLAAPGKAAPDYFAEMKSRLVDSKAKLENAPDDLTIMTMVAEQYEEFGDRLLKAKQTRGSIESLREATRLRERLTRANPLDVQPMKALATTLGLLGKAHFQLREFDQAYTCFHRRCDLLEQCQRVVPNNDQQASIAETHLIFGELAEVRGDLSEALRWYVVASQENQPRANRKAANLLKKTPSIGSLLLAEHRTVFARMQKDGKVDSSTFVADFDKAVTEEVTNARAESARKRNQELTDQRIGLMTRASMTHDSAIAAKQKGQTDDYRQALVEEYDLRSQITQTDPKNARFKNGQAEIAAELGESFAESNLGASAAIWSERAANLGHMASLFQMADWYEKGTNVKSDPEKANRYRYFGLYLRGTGLFRESRYSEALPDLIKVCESSLADADDHNRLGMCYGKLGRWQEAVGAYTRSIELDVKSGEATGHILNAFEAMIIAEKPEELLRLVDLVKAKGWTPPKKGANADKDNALYHGFRAMAYTMDGKDASEAERSMHEFTGKDGFAITDWSWEELDHWLKMTKLAPDRKATVEKIVGELKGASS